MGVHGAACLLLFCVLQYYRLATKNYLRNGKDGYECLKTAEVLVSFDARRSLDQMSLMPSRKLF